MFKLQFTTAAKSQLASLQKDHSLKKRLKANLKALAFLETNPKHPGLNTYKYTAFTGPRGEDIFEAYAEENKTPAAYRIFWYYGPNKKQITIVAITPHP